MMSAATVIKDAENFIRRFCILPDAAYLPVATWVVATYTPLAFDAFPYLAFLSPMKRCGKTRLLEVLELLCAKPQRVTTVSSASLFRMMEEVPTLLLDEVEALRNSKPSETAQAVLAILNAGHRQGASVTRCEPPNWEVRHFSVYGPKAFAAIGGLPDTLTDRCIIVTMQRKTPSQVVGRFLQGRARADAEPIRESLTGWAEAWQDAVRGTYEEMDDLKYLSDRDADIWMPLFAVCTIAAPERLGELRQCAETLSGAKAANDVDDSIALKLLADMRRVWSAEGAKLRTETLLQRLADLAESPWATLSLNPIKLAALLRPFNIAPKQIRIGNDTGKGYLWAELAAAFERYLPDVPGKPETPVTSRASIEASAFRHPSHAAAVTPHKLHGNLRQSSVVTGVSTATPKKAEAEVGRFIKGVL